jgi:putative transposase
MGPLLKVTQLDNPSLQVTLADGKLNCVYCDYMTNKLREAEVLLSRGSTVGEASKRIGVTEQTYYRWRREYGGMRVEQARRLKELEKENIRLKKLVADLSLDNAILKEAARGNS